MQNLFEGLRVVDFTNNLAGPVSTAFLADFGAEVIKIEKPRVGDDSRFFAPLLEGVGVPFIWANRGKKSIVLDMKELDGREIAKKLIADADLVVESFKPGTMKSFGLDYENIRQLNSKIILCSISAFGQTGPYSQKPGYDAVTQALSGIMDMTGGADGPPNRIGFTIADYNAAIFAYGAIASALYYRERTGKGQHIDISLLDCLASFNGSIENAGLGDSPTRTGNHHGALCPFGIFQGNGGMVIICTPSQGLWTALCKIMGLEDVADEPFCRDNFSRVKNSARIIGIIEDWLQTFSNINEPLMLMDEAGIPCAQIKSTTDLLSDIQLRERGMITELETPDGMSVKTIIARGNPLKFSDVQAILKKAPGLGRDTEEILKSIGYETKKIAEIKTKWNI